MNNEVNNLKQKTEFEEKMYKWLVLSNNKATIRANVNTNKKIIMKLEVKNHK